MAKIDQAPAFVYIVKVSCHGEFEPDSYLKCSATKPAQQSRFSK